jgi:hypothetical protein
VEKMGTLNGSDGDGQWKRWGRSMEVMGLPSSSTILSPLSRDRGDDKATRKMLQMAMFFRTLVGQRCSEHMGMASGKDGDGQWK